MTDLPQEIIDVVAILSRRMNPEIDAITLIPFPKDGNKFELYAKGKKVEPPDADTYKREYELYIAEQKQFAEMLRIEEEAYAENERIDKQNPDKQLVLKGELKALQDQINTLQEQVALILSLLQKAQK